MRTTFRMLLVHLVLLVTMSVAIAQRVDDPLFRAMQNELDRSMRQLSIEGMPSPYFLSYRVHDVETAVVEARYGALVGTDTSEKRYFYIECRVGTPSFDNSSFIGTWRDMYNMRKDLVEENDYQAIRHQIWLYTDEAYKNALENLARKDAYVQAHPSKERISDFAPAESFVHMEEPVSLERDLSAWKSEIRTAAKGLRDFPSLQDWKVMYTATAENKRYMNSEGSKHLKGALYGVLEVVATAQAQDGQRLTSFLRYVTRGADEPPTGEKLREDIRKMASELEAMVRAPTLEEYTGPILFEDYAAAQFVSQLFAAQLSPAKTPLAAVEWLRRRLPDPKLAGRVNRRVFPDFVTVRDNPGMDSWGGVSLAGHQAVDDEGVKCQEITLVEEGRLAALPMSRQPTKKIQESNGHAYTFENQWTAPTVTNVIVETTKPEKDLVKKLRKLCRDFGNEYGLLVTRLEDPSLSKPYRWTEVSEESPPLLTSPVAMYKVYEQDGRMEPVRGLVFDEVSIRALRSVAAVGRDARAVNLLQPMSVEGVRYPAAIVTPGILVEEMEFTASSAHEPLPVSARPGVAD